MEKKDAVRQLLLSTTALLGVLSGYARRAYSQQVCVQTGTDIVCDGGSTETQSLTGKTNATVTTGDSFEVRSATGNGLTLTGDGQLSYTDDNVSPLIAPYFALYVFNSGDSGGVGGVTIDTNGYLKANTGLYVYNQASGGTSITANNTVYGNYYGVHAKNYAGGLSIVTGGPVTGYYGINLKQSGSGALSVTANGDVTGTSDSGIFALNDAGSSFAITTAVGTTVSGATDGIQAINISSGSSLEITANGDVQGSQYGIYASNSGTDLTINTGAGTTVSADKAIQAKNNGSGANVINVAGNVYGSSYSIFAQNGTGSAAAGTDITITTEAGTLVRGQRGIFVGNYGSGAITISAYGDVTGTSQYGIYAFNGSGTDINITTGGTVEGSGAGIWTYQKGSGAINIAANGDVTGDSYGIFAGFDKNSNGSLYVTTGVGSSVKGANGIQLEASVYGQFGYGVTGGATIIANGSVTGNSNGFGIYAKNQSDAPLLVSTGNQSVIRGGKGGIGAVNYGGTITVRALGDVYSDNYSAIDAANYGLFLKVTTGTGTVEGAQGIYANNNGSGYVSITP